VLGGKLQVEACVAQCVDKVGAALSDEDPGPAMEVLESVPSELDGRKDVEALRNKGLYFLLKAIRTGRVVGVELQRAWSIVVDFIIAGRGREHGGGAGVGGARRSGPLRVGGSGRGEEGGDGRGAVPGAHSPAVDGGAVDELLLVRGALRQG
jgi:hypothetical protein